MKPNTHQEDSVPSEEEIAAGLASFQPASSPRFHARMASAPWTAAGQQTAKNATASFRSRRFALVLLIVSLGLVVVLMTPPGWALAQGVFRFFTNAGSDTVPITTVIGTLETPDYSATPVWDPWKMSVEDAEAIAGYPVVVPAVIPEGFLLIGAQFNSDDRSVTILYEKDFGMGGSTLTPPYPYLFPGPGCQVSWKGPCLDLLTIQKPSAPSATLFADLVGSSAKIETVKIGDFSGEYVEGGWTLDNPVAVWDPSPWWRTLRWQVDDKLFEIFIGPGDPESMVKNEMIQWAEQMLR